MKIGFNILLSCIMKWKQNHYIRYWIFTSLFIVCFSFSTTMSQQLLKGHVPAAVKKLGLKSIGQMDSNINLHLAIGLPLRNKEELTHLLKQVYDPASPNYHHYLTTEQFTAQFGPTVDDYQSLVEFVTKNDLTVTRTTPNRLILDVDGKVTNIEKLFHVHLLKYQHPTESRTFFAPDVEPTPSFPVPILQISGMSNYSLPRPCIEEDIETVTVSGYKGYDFRNAYVKGSPYNGSGQTVAVLEFGGFYQNDITYYENIAGLPNVPIVPTLLWGFLGTPAPSPEYQNYELEVSVDIEMVISMAPGLSKVMVYEEPYYHEDAQINWIDMLNQVVLDNEAKIISFSWQLDGVGSNQTAENDFLEMQAQGQSFFQASGDKKAYTGLIDFPGDDANITIVGGTTLSTGPDSSWVSEMAWNDNDAGSGGGISNQFGIPSWQQGISMATNGGSTTMRNIPDVSLTASNIYVRYYNGTNAVTRGTSCAAPLWAGFAALINQRAAENDQQPIGFVNPFIYSLGKGPNYNTYFHDIISGGNTTYGAVSGFDLCTGWGTPKGIDLIEAFVPINNIHVDQKLSTGTQIGTIGKWNGSSFSPRLNPGDSISIYPGSTIILQGDQNVYNGEKYNNWIRNTSLETDVSNHHSFIIRPNDRNFTSNFQPMHNATIQSLLLETGSIGGFLKFQDPWLKDYQDAGYGNNIRNQGMTAPFNTVNFASNNLGINTPHLGVILNQETRFGTYYSIQAPLIQTISAHNCVFQNWESSDATFQQVGSNPSGYDQKAVIFNNSGSTVTANYKGIHLSNTASAFSNNSQRKVVRIQGGTIHLVYESMGHVWWEISTDNGTSWTIANNGHPLDNGAGKLPSIDYYSNLIAIVFQQQNGNNYDIVLKVFPSNCQDCILSGQSTIHTEIYDAYSVNANPNISFGYDGYFIVNFERKQNGSPGINYISGIIGNYNDIAVNETGWFPGTNSNSINTTITTTKVEEEEDTIRFHVAWEENNTIKYCVLKIEEYDENPHVIFSGVDVPSTGNTYSYNNNPQIAVNYLGDAYLTWIGTNNPGNESSKVVNRARNGSCWSSTFNYYGTNVASPTLQFVYRSNDYIIAWSQGNGSSNKFYRSDNSGILDYGILGRSIQVINGNSLEAMYSISFNNFSLPYYFQMTHSSVVPKTLTLTALIEAMYVASGTAMSMAPSVTVELHNASTPYSLVESQTATLSTAGVGSFNFTNALNGASYYIVVKYLNTIETWSATPQCFTNGILNYNFTTGLGQAYTDGSNPPMALHNGKYCIYSGDCNQDGFVSGPDFAGVDYDNTNFEYHLVNDLNGDGYISGDDFTFIENNNENFIQKQVPPGVPASKRDKYQLKLADKNKK
ncbi:MAG: S53 family serine peptidase [Ignavibacteriaceae bacterium]|nr:S53 family serine peptidase [Ignavibacteriaceae bacterium]